MTWNDMKIYVTDAMVPSHREDGVMPIDNIVAAVDSIGISINKCYGWIAHRWSRKPVFG